MRSILRLIPKSGCPAYTIRTMMEKLGHERVDLLKIDFVLNPDS